MVALKYRHSSSCVAFPGLPSANERSSVLTHYRPTSPNRYVDLAPEDGTLFALWVHDSWAEAEAVEVCVDGNLRAREVVHKRKGCAILCDQFISVIVCSRPGYCCIIGVIGGDAQVLAVEGRDMKGGEGLTGEACP